MRRNIEFSNDDLSNICNLYINGLSLCNIGLKYNCCKSVIKRVLVNNNIEIRDDSHKIRYYTLNENYFDDINSHEKAYIIGLLFADGYNCESRHQIKLELQEQDRDILDKINVEIGSNRNLKFTNKKTKNKNWSNTYKLDIYNKHMSQTLSQLGMCQAKSMILKFPEWLSKEYYSSFFRGLIDGDGYISKKSNSVELVGNEPFLNHMKNEILKIMDVHIYIKNSPNPKSITKVLRITGYESVKKFLDFIYENSTIHMNRKYHVYKEKYNYNLNKPLIE